MKENWNEDFEQSLVDQGLVVSKPVKHEISTTIVETVKTIESLISAKRMGIIKSLHLDKPSLPPFILELRETNLMMIFFIDEPDETIHPKLMDFAVYHFGVKMNVFPSNITAVFFNIISNDVDKSYLAPYLPNDTEQIRKQFSNPIVLKTTVNGFKQLLDIAKIEEFPLLHNLPEIKDLDIDYLLRLSSGYFFESVYLEGKNRLEKLMQPECPLCGSQKVKNSVPTQILERLKLSDNLSFENSAAYYCSKQEGGCGVGFLIVHDERLGGIHGFHTGDIHTYTHDYSVALEKVREIGLDIHSFTHIDLE
ncbi:MAG: hypothetical protein ACTSPI_04760 [Candidatus Heimdallarchaeaceae archaeon]